MCQIDPVRDSRWEEFLQRYLGSSVFHSSSWLEALRRTYGYEPVVLTTSPPDAELSNGIVFCQISSWLTGSRLVSLPFSDHCHPLVGAWNDFELLMGWLTANLKLNGWRYVELRTASPLDANEARQRALQEMCRVIFNLSEFVYAD